MKNRRKNIINDAMFQLKYTSIMLIVVLSMPIMIGCLMYLYDNLVYTLVSEYIITGEGSVEAYLQSVSQHTRFSIIQIALFCIAVCLSLLVLGLYSSHRIVGPFVRFKKSLQELQDGELPETIHLRKGDMGKDIADAINGVIESQRNLRQDPAGLLQLFEESVKNPETTKTPELKKELKRLTKLV